MPLACLIPTLAVMNDARAEPLPGDDGEPVVSRGLGRDLRTMPTSALRPTAAIVLGEEALVSEAVERMKAEGASCVLVVAADDAQRLVGSFCERDVLEKVLNARDPGSTRLSEVMCCEPPSVKENDAAAFVLNKMIVDDARQVAVLDSNGAPVGVVTMKHVLELLAERYPQGLLNLPPESIIPETRAGA